MDIWPVSGIGGVGGIPQQARTPAQENHLFKHEV